MIELMYVPAYYYLIKEIEIQDDLSWSHDIYLFLKSDTYPEATIAMD